MESFIGTSIPVFVGVTLFVMGGCAAMTGQAIAATWRPFSLVLFYAVLLGAADRFLIFALFEGELFSLKNYIFDTIILVAFTSVAYQITKARKMVSQYPWVYEAVGLFGWREIPNK